MYYTGKGSWHTYWCKNLFHLIYFIHWCIDLSNFQKNIFQGAAAPALWISGLIPTVFPSILIVPFHPAKEFSDSIKNFNRYFFIQYRGKYEFCTRWPLWPWPRRSQNNRVLPCPMRVTFGCSIVRITKKLWPVESWQTDTHRLWIELNWIDWIEFILL